ncbi:hypothetical protein PYCCODRAFT_1464276 [Trametes coccinea BRFM310]|uniref:Molybdopterin synthase sulfur carrier subunit n=1 Tax=Trametes coccinea (strain BRFM310) TaxID=1353009 RepID=A0A1Y2IZ25_TRAC3|nr:hypothetical protein PYCCODRAFT_1464276 [Trametes coccinea BRFM310]
MSAGPDSDPPTITVLYFAAASTATGLTTEAVPLQDPSRGLPLSQLSDVLAARHPGTNLREVLAQSQWAVDEEMVDDPARVVLKGGEEVAVVCPVSGG